MVRGAAPILPFVFASGAAALAADVRTALAAEEPEPIQIAYSASRACPPASAFEREVKDRTIRPWIPGGRESARTLKVAIKESDGLYRGRLIVEEPSGASQSDEVPWERCDDVVSALAVKAAIAIDASPPRLLPSLAPKASRYLAWDAPRWAFQPAQISIDERPQPWRVTVGAGLLGTGAISPGLAPAASIFLDVSRIGEGLEAITIRLSLLRAIGDFRADDEIVTMEWIASRLEACPLHRNFPPFTISPCMAVDTGAAIWKVEPPGVARHWISLDFIGRVQATVFERLILELQAGAIVPLTRFEFGLGPDKSSGKSLHRIPVISGMLGGGTGVRFP